jgi:hypothetical protein
MPSVYYFSYFSPWLPESRTGTQAVSRIAEQEAAIRDSPSWLKFDVSFS